MKIINTSRIREAAFAVTHLQNPQSKIFCIGRIIKASFAVMFLLSFASYGLSQTYTYDPSGATNNSWGDSVKWGLVSPAYPSGDGIIVNLLKVGATTHMNFVDAPTVTLGTLNIGSSGAGSSRWELKNNGTITLANGGNAAVISNTSGNTAYIQSALVAANGVHFTGPNSMIMFNSTSSIQGGIEISGGGAKIFNAAQIVNSSSITMSGNAADMRFTGNNFDITSNILLSTAGHVKYIYANPATNGVLKLSGDITGSANLILESETANRNATVELTGQNTYTGTTTARPNILFHELRNFGDGDIILGGNGIAQRTLTYAAGNTADITKKVDGSARNITFSSDVKINTGTNNVVYTNTIGGIGVLTKAGTGELTLFGNNTFSGAVIESGRVTAGHTNALGGGTKDSTIKDAILAITEGVNLQVNNLTLESNAHFVFNLNNTLDATQITVNGNQIGSGTYLVDILPPGGGFSEFETYTLLTVDGTANAAGFILGAPSAGYGDLSWNNNVLTFTTVPEPSVAWLALLGGTLLIYRYKKRK